MTKLRLQIDVDYDPNGVPSKVLEALLGDIPFRTEDEGLFTGKTDAEVKAWDALVTHVTGAEEPPKSITDTLAAALRGLLDRGIIDDEGNFVIEATPTELDDEVNGIQATAAATTALERYDELASSNLRSCADLLLEAYAKGEARESVDWEDVDLAHEAAIRELPERHDELDKLYAELDEDDEDDEDEDEDEDEEICPACEASVDLSEAESCRVDGQDGYICPSCGTRVPLGD